MVDIQWNYQSLGKTLNGHISKILHYTLFLRKFRKYKEFEGKNRNFRNEFKILGTPDTLH